MTDTVVELFTEAEWVRFHEAAQEAARRRGGFFVLDESVRMVSERAWATYLREIMLSVGVEDLAARIDPSRFAGHGDLIVDESWSTRPTEEQRKALDALIRANRIDPNRRPEAIWQRQDRIE